MPPNIGVPLSAFRDQDCIHLGREELENGLVLSADSVCDCRHAFGKLISTHHFGSKRKLGPHCKCTKLALSMIGCGFNAFYLDATMSVLRRA